MGSGGAKFEARGCRINGSSRAARLLILLGLTCYNPLWAKPPVTFSYLGFDIDESRLGQDQRSAVKAGLRQQIDLVHSLAIEPDIAAFLQTVPVRIDPSLREPGHYDQTGLRLRDKQSPADNPVLLHELPHAWLSKASASDRRIIQQAYAAAVSSGRYPRDAYMMTDVAEFFAMTTSVVLWGRAARLPFVRERVQAEMPEFYASIVQRFGLHLL